MTGDPCFFCGARPDIACKHRAADPEWTPPRFVDKPDLRKTKISGGGQFRMPDIKDYRRGPDGNGRNFRKGKHA